jgi:biotin synthase-like enzyme
MAGANSVFLGEKLLTTLNHTIAEDKDMFEVLGLRMK